MATYNRPQLCERSLRSVLSAIARGDLPHFDVVVGINGHDPETTQMVQSLQREPSGSIIHLEAFTERRTPAAARNQLLPLTKGDWVYFLDDDAFVEPDFFAKFAANPMLENCVAIGGPNLNPPNSGYFQTWSSHALASRFATYFSSARYVPQGTSRLCSEESLILCNLFVRREVLREDSFLESLVCAEENWLLQGLTSAQHRLVYDPNLFVWHERRPNLTSFTRQVFKYGFGRGQIFRRRPTGLHWAHVLPLLCLIYTAIITLGFCLQYLSAKSWLVPFPLYAGLCVLAAAGQKSIPSAFLFPVIHVTYGWGLFWGILRG